MPNVTEMSFLVVPAQRFIQQTNDCNTLEDITDSVLENLVAYSYSSAINPMLTENGWNKYESEFLPCVKQKGFPVHEKSFLLDQKSFKDQWPIIHKTFASMEKPACIFAHNGLRFDFQILYNELNKNDLIATYPIPNDVYFVDTYGAFVSIAQEYHKTIIGQESDGKRHFEKRISEFIKNTGNSTLSGLHKKIFGYEFTGAHSSLSDCKALMKISLAYGPYFPSFIEKNFVEFPKSFL